LYWQSQIAGNPVIAILMPFASASAKDGFLHRIEDWLSVRFSGNFDSLGIHLRTIDFSEEDPVIALAEMFRSG
jgi:hypothetical protein